MRDRFDKKVILITGAASGIGLTTTRKLKDLGATLCLCDINEALNTLLVEEFSETEHGQSISAKVFDVGSNTACKDFVSEMITLHAHIDHVFNCAGVNPAALATTEFSDDYWDKLVNCNLKGLFNMTRACIPHMPPGSTFVNVSSIAGLRPVAGYAVYCATKYGIIGFSKCVALELGSKGIWTNIVAPGYIDTPTNAMVVVGQEAVDSYVDRISLGRFGTADEVADVVIFLMSKEARYMNGSVVEINGGAKA